MGGARRRIGSRDSAAETAPGKRGRPEETRSLAVAENADIEACAGDVSDGPRKRERSAAAAREHWQQIWDRIYAHRIAHPTAPVDTMGCERLFDAGISPAMRRFQVLVGLMLSSQTRDEMTSQVHARLRNELEGGLRVSSILSTPVEQLERLLFGVGFYRRKALYLKQTCEILHDKFQDDIPETLEGLLELPGVGPKMAFIALNVAWGKPHLGIGVDVHVHRICNRLGWCRTKSPEETRVAIEALLPRDIWKDVNYILVGFGQTVCTPLRPNCATCPVSHLCPKIGTSLPKTNK